MPTLTDATAVAEAVRERFDSGLRQIEQNVERGRRMIAKAQNAAEDGVAATVQHVRRHPLRDVAAATAIGALVGCVIGFAYGRCARR